VDLVKLINRIPANLDIPSLKYKLIKIMSDCTLQGSVRTGCNTILKRDCISLQQRFNIRAKKAMRVYHIISYHTIASLLCALCDIDRLKWVYNVLIVMARYLLVN
jgi:hypothetical protein